jgi:hypothetical protein
MGNDNGQLTFAAWSQAVDDLCLRHFCCSWDDLCGEREVLERAYVSAETPQQFVSWFGEKFDLIGVESIPYLAHRRG